MTDLPKAIDKSSGTPTRTRYFVLAWFCGAAAIAYICRNSIGVAESTIRENLKLTEEQMGTVMQAFFLVYALAQVPTGYLAHRLGTRLLAPLLSVAWSAGTAMLSLATGFSGLIAARMTIGLAQAGLFPSTTSSVARWFPKNERAIANGAIGGFMAAGGALGMVFDRLPE